MADSNLYLIALLVVSSLLLVSTIALVLALLFFGNKFVEFSEFYYQQSHFKVHHEITGIRSTLGANELQRGTIFELLSRISQHLYLIEKSIKDREVN